MELAQQPPTGKAALPVTSDFYAVRSEIDLSTIYDRLYRETLRLFEDFSQRGLTGRELADAVVGELDGLSDAPVQQAARGAATEAFNLGRNLAAQVKADDIVGVVRTEVLDANTCDPCGSLDGFTTTVNGPGYFENMPPNHCDGREMCRGFYLYRAQRAA